jgi:hypothetical protein
MLVSSPVDEPGQQQSWRGRIRSDLAIVLVAVMLLAIATVKF